MSDLVACVDFGSTYTKALLVDVGNAVLVARAERPTTLDGDVMDGWLECREQLAATEPGASRAPVLACSSAGGGLRIAVVGNEELVTAEAGRRVALSSGGAVVHVAPDGLSSQPTPLAAARPDVVLLVGGTDGGNAEVIVAAAGRLARAGWSGPVVVAGNIEAADRVVAILTAAGIEHAVTANVVPRIGVLRPEPARAAIRAMFLRHVIGGQRLSDSAEFRAMVTGPTPDLVLGGVELLAEQHGPMAVVDVGGATTDVYSVGEVEAEDGGLAREVVARTPAARTVEGDLGMRWSAVTTVAAAVQAGLVSEGERAGLAVWADSRGAKVSSVPAGAGDLRWDLRLAELAAAVALRRHAGRQRVSFRPDGRLVERTGTDLREVRLLVGSGGVLRHAGTAETEAVLRSAAGDVGGGWLLPRAPRVVVDTSYVLVAAGLLRAQHRDAARALLHRYISVQAHV